MAFGSMARFNASARWRTFPPTFLKRAGQIGFITDTKTLVSLNHGGHPCFAPSLLSSIRSEGCTRSSLGKCSTFELRFTSRPSIVQFSDLCPMDLRYAAFNPILDSNFGSYRDWALRVICWMYLGNWRRVSSEFFDAVIFHFVIKVSYFGFLIVSLRSDDEKIHFCIKINI